MIWHVEVVNGACCDVVERRGAEGMEIAQRRGAEGVEIAQQRGTEGVKIAQRRGAEGVEIAQRRGAEGVEMRWNGATLKSNRGRETDFRSQDSIND